MSSLEQPVLSLQGSLMAAGMAMAYTCAQYHPPTVSVRYQWGPSSPMVPLSTPAHVHTQPLATDSFGCQQNCSWNIYQRALPSSTTYYVHQPAATPPSTNVLWSQVPPVARCPHQMQTNGGNCPRPRALSAPPTITVTSVPSGQRTQRRLSLQAGSSGPKRTPPPTAKYSPTVSSHLTQPKTAKTWYKARPAIDSPHSSSGSSGLLSPTEKTHPSAQHPSEKSYLTQDAFVHLKEENVDLKLEMIRMRAELDALHREMLSLREAVQRAPTWQRIPLTDHSSEHPSPDVVDKLSNELDDFHPIPIKAITKAPDLEPMQTQGTLLELKCYAIKPIVHTTGPMFDNPAHGGRNVSDIVKNSIHPEDTGKESILQKASVAAHTSAGGMRSRGFHPPPLDASELIYPEWDAK